MKKTLSILYIRELGMWGEVLCGRNKSDSMFIQFQDHMVFKIGIQPQSRQLCLVKLTTED